MQLSEIIQLIMKSLLIYFYYKLFHNMLLKHQIFSIIFLNIREWENDILSEHNDKTGFE